MLMKDYMQIAPFSYAILISTIAVSLYALYGNQNLINRFILHPYAMFRNKAYSTLITSGFIHADLGHLFFNMYSFHSFAVYLEAMAGSIRLCIIYFVSILAGSVVSAVLNKNNIWYRTLGASGGVSGVIFSCILYNPAMKIGFIFIPIGIPAPVFAILYLLYCQYASKNSNDNINHDAHFWGAVAGMIATIILQPAVLFNLLRGARITG